MIRGARLSITLLVLALSYQTVLAAEDDTQTTIAFSVSELDGKPRVKIAIGDLVFFTDSVVMLDSAGKRIGLSVQGDELEIQEKGGTKNVDETAIRVWDKPAAGPRKTMARFSVKSLDGHATLRIAVGDLTLHTSHVVVARPDGKRVAIGIKGNDVQLKGPDSETSANKFEVGIRGDGFAVLSLGELMKLSNAKPGVGK